MQADSLTVRIGRVTDEAEGIKTFELVDPAGGELPPFTAGAHVVVYLEGGLARHYSLANDPMERHRYLIAVLRDPNSRGGSDSIHDTFEEGTLLEISRPVNNFPLAETAERHLLIAGGIGITPMAAMVHELERNARSYRLYYCTRGPGATAFKEELSHTRLADKVKFIHDEGDPSKGLQVAALLADPGEGQHLYVCGPQGLITAVREAAAHWPAGNVHFEFFAADSDEEIHQEGDQAFEVKIASSGQVITVPADKTILEALTAAGIEVPHLCEEGYCGSCLTDVLSGEPDHRDVVLTDEERQSNEMMTVCCSRTKRGRLVLDL